MGPFHTPQRKNGGYSLIEMLVVLAIVGILAMAGASMIGNRSGTSVRAILDELEGGLVDAQKYAVATGKDVALVTWGDWSAANPLGMARGFATLTATQIKASALDPVGNPQISVSTCYRLQVSGTAVSSRDQRNAGVDANKGWWATAKGSSDDITAKAPFDGSTTGFALGAQFLCTGLATPSVGAVVSGANKRFTASFSIKVVALSSGGAPIPGGPMGLIYVQANGGTIYKFYNPGTSTGDGKWRRL